MACGFADSMKPAQPLRQRAVVIETSPEQDFRHYCQRGDAVALGRVFDSLAPQLLLVAAHMAGGGSAEDLVQATFVDAIRHRGRWDGRRPLAPWLCGILANHVRMELRRRQRHPVPDAARLPRGEGLDPGDAAAAAELCEVVRAAVAGLPLGYHQVLTLRFVHGLELQQIAHSLRLPLGTVKTRLYRGLALVKRALPAGLATAFAAVVLPGRGLAAVREVVLGHAGAAAGAAAGTVGATVVVSALSSGAVIGAMAMQKVMLAVGVVVLVIGGWLAVAAIPREPVQPQITAPTSDPVAAAQAPAPEVRKQPFVAAPAVRAAAPVNERTAVPSTGSIVMHAIWKGDGAPAANIDIGYLPAGGRPGESRSKSRTDADGVGRVDGLAPGRWFVGVMPQMQAFEVSAGTVTRVEITIADYLQLQLAVVDGEDQSVAGASIWALGWTNTEPPVQLGSSDRAGRFSCRSLPLRSLLARMPGRVPAVSGDLFEARGDLDVRLVLDQPACTLRGTVKDPQGRPVPFARVLIGTDESYPFAGQQVREPLDLRADARGEFACDEALPGEHTVLALDDRFASLPQTVTLANGAPTTCTVQLLAGACVEGRVTDRAGQPLVGAVVSTAEAPLPIWRFGRVLEVRTDVDGRYRLLPLRPGHREVAIAADGLPPAKRWFELQDAETGTWAAQLPEGGDLAGRVVDGDGKPLAGWRVHIAGVDQTTGGMRMEERDGATDGEGRFALVGLPDLPYRVMVFAAGARGPALQVARAVASDVRPPRLDLDFRIDGAHDPEGWILARVVRSLQQAAMAGVVTVNPLERETGAGLPEQRFAAGADDARIGPLPAGDYRVSVRLDGGAMIAGPIVHLTAGESLELPPFRFDLQRPLRLRLRLADGRPVADAMVEVFGDQGSGASRIHVGADQQRPGDYETSPLSPGSYEVRVRGESFAAEAFRVAVEEREDNLCEHTVQQGVAMVFQFLAVRSSPLRAPVFDVCLSDAAGAVVVRELADVDAGGNWSARLLPGSYTLDVSASPGGVARLPFTVTADPAANTLRVQLADR